MPPSSCSIQEPRHLVAIAVLALAMPSDSQANNWEFQFSPYTYHYSEDPAHRPVMLGGLARIENDGWLVGGALFSNSFGQPCGYGLFGQQYARPWGLANVYWSWSAGLIYGYKEPYANKVPLNWHGFSPAFVPSVGYRLTRDVAVQLAVLGTAGFMLSLNYDLNR